MGFFIAKIAFAGLKSSLVKVRSLGARCALGLNFQAANMEPCGKAIAGAAGAGPGAGKNATPLPHAL